MKFDYDSIEGVLNHTNTLENVHNLLDVRIQARKNGETLNEFVIFGKYVLDQFGQCLKIQDKIPNIPVVIKKEDIYKYVDSFSCSFSNEIGSYDKICPICKNGWDLHNIDDVHRICKSELIKKENSENRSIKEILEVLNWDIGKKYFVGFSDTFIKNKKYIDMSPWSEGSDYPKNKDGWVGKIERPELDENYILEDGDELYVHYFEYYHKDCYKNKINDETEKEFIKIFKDAEIGIVNLKRIKNEYCSCILCSDWFEIETFWEKFKIGWRKRVINIEFFTKHKEVNFLDIFKDEDVTKGENYIHAWGYEKATEYLRKISDSNL